MWGYGTLFHREKSIQKILRKDKYSQDQFEKNFLIDPLTTDNAIYREWLTLSGISFNGNKIYSSLINSYA